MHSRATYVTVSLGTVPVRFFLFSIYPEHDNCIISYRSALPDKNLHSKLALFCRSFLLAVFKSTFTGKNYVQWEIRLRTMHSNVNTTSRKQISYPPLGGLVGPVCSWYENV